MATKALVDFSVLPKQFRVIFKQEIDYFMHRAKKNNGFLLGRFVKNWVLPQLRNPNKIPILRNTLVVLFPKKENLRSFVEDMRYSLSVWKEDLDQSLVRAYLKSQLNTGDCIVANVHLGLGEHY